MIHQIGEAAGRVWKFLDEKGEASLAQIKKGVKADPNLVLQGIGWLAREDKLKVDKTGRFVKYALKK